MRKLILDTETTGLDYENDRIIEVACLELFDDVITGNTFHKYYNPGEIIISDQAEQIHGLSNSFLRKFEKFDDQVDDLIDFIADSFLIIHNAQFDISMLNSSFKRSGKPIIKDSRTICTLEMAKKKFPGSKNNLNALCRRFNISLEDRVKHGALTDCRLLSEVYIELLGGRQEKLLFSQKEKIENHLSDTRAKELEYDLVDLSEKELNDHTKILKKLSNPIW